MKLPLISNDLYVSPVRIQDILHQHLYCLLLNLNIFTSDFVILFMM